MKRLLLWSLLLFLVHLSCPIRAGVVVSTDSLPADSVCRQVHHFVYRINSARIDFGFKGNTTELAGLDSLVNETVNRPEQSVFRIDITGFSSIEGSYPYNHRLATQRAETLHRFMRERYPQLHDSLYHIHTVGEDWEGLKRHVEASNITQRMEVLEIICKVSQPDAREKLLRSLNGGKAYKELQDSVFPEMRRVRVSHSRPPSLTPALSKGEGEGRSGALEEVQGIGIEQDIVQDTEQDIELDIELDIEEGIEQSIEPEYIADVTPSPSPLERAGVRLSGNLIIKTNLLSWAGLHSNSHLGTTVANGALEVYLSPRLSVEAGVAYSYWHYNNDEKFQGVTGYRIEPRWWFVPARRMGIFTGLYGRMGDYDIRSGEPQLAVTGHYRDAGVSAGVYLALIGPLGLEMGARGGYITTKAKHYVMNGSDKHYTHRTPFSGIRVTDWNVSLVYRLR